MPKLSPEKALAEIQTRSDELKRIKTAAKLCKSAQMLTVHELRSIGAMQRWRCMRHGLLHGMFWADARKVIEAERDKDGPGTVCPTCLAMADEPDSPVPYKTFAAAVKKQLDRLDKSAAKSQRAIRNRGNQLRDVL